MENARSFCRYGWVRTMPDEHDAAFTPIAFQDAAGNASEDRLYKAEVVRPSRHFVLSTIAFGTEFCVPTEDILASVQFFDEMVDVCRAVNVPQLLNQQNFHGRITSGLTAVNSYVCRPDPFDPLTKDEGRILCLEAFIGRWARTKPRWFKTRDDALAMFHETHSSAGGAFLRCAFEIDEDQLQAPIVACWLYAESDGCALPPRWDLTMWPSTFPPLRIPEK